MRRVTVVGLHFPPEPSGNAPYTGSMAEGLARRGREVTVVTGVPHYPQWRRQPGHPPGRSTTEHGVRLVRRNHPVPERPRLASRLLMEVAFGLSASVAGWNRPGVLVLVTPALFGNVFASLRARLLRIPTVVWVQDIYSVGVSETGSAGGLAARGVAAVERWLLRGATRVVVIHDRFKDVLVRDLGVDPDSVVVIRNWSNVQPVVNEDRAAARARMGWPDDVQVVLHAGNMGAKQGLENVVRASQVADREGRPMLFVLMGDGNRRAALEAMGENGALAIVDPVADAHFVATLHAADVLLVNELPGLSEMSVPSKLTSYYATERPVLAATDAGSVTAQEIATSGAGVRVDADDPAALVAAAARLAAEPDRAADLGTAGLRFRAAHLTADAALGSFDRLISDVLDDRRASAPR